MKRSVEGYGWEDLIIIIQDGKIGKMTIGDVHADSE